MCVANVPIVTAALTVHPLRNSCRRRAQIMLILAMRVMVALTVAPNPNPKWYTSD